MHHQLVRSAWLSQSWKELFDQRFITQAFDLVSWRLSAQLPMVPVSLGHGAMGIVISPLVGLIEQQVSASMTHVVSVYVVRFFVLRYLSLCLLESLLFMHFAQNIWPT